MVKKALSEAAWERMLQEQASSGLTVREFCQRRSVAASTLFAWKRNLAAADYQLPTTLALLRAGRYLDSGR